MKRFFVAAALLFLAMICNAQFLRPEKEGLERTLFLGNLLPNQLSIAKSKPVDSKAPTLVWDSLQNPISSAERLMELHQSATASPLRVLKLSAGLFPDSAINPTLSVPEDAVPSTIPKPYQFILGSIAHAVAVANAQVRNATEQLTPAQKRELVESLPSWVDDDPEFRFDFVRGSVANEKAIFSLLSKVDLPRIRAAAVDLAEALNDLVPRLQTISRTNPFGGQIKFNIGKMVCVFAGTGSNVHADKDAMLTIDLGGNDEYKGRHGAGVGYASVLLDLGGNDRYQTPDLSVGAGVLGIGFAYDFGGYDVYRGGSLSFGSAIAGVGVLYKKGGEDIYQTKRLSLGFASFGIGIFLDDAGSDQYSAERWAQGASKGDGVGWFVDLAGDDTIRIKEAQIESKAQGYAEGSPDSPQSPTGGIGLLTNIGGSDVYVAGSMAQAAANGIGIGSIFDSAGTDRYLVSQSGIGFAINFGCSFLFDLEGNDSYLVPQGSGISRSHSFGIALLFDRSGDDYFAGANFGPAFASANGVSIFLDADGEDHYSGAPGLISDQAGNQSISVFSDLNGPDSYGFGIENGTSRVGANGGAATDEPTTTKLSVPQEQGPAPVPGSNPVPGNASLYQELVAASKKLGNARQDAVFHLISYGVPALDSINKNQLAELNARELTAYGEVLKGNGEAGRNSIALCVSNPNDAVAAKALRICFEFEFKEAGAVIIQALKRPKLQLLASKCAGMFGNSLAGSELMLLCSQSDTELVVNCLRSLAIFADPQSSGTAQALLDSQDRQVLNAAMALLTKFPAPAMASGRIFLREGEVRKARIGCEILTALGSSEALKELGVALSDARPGVRIQALTGLAGRCPAEFRAKFVELRTDFDAQVRAVAVLLDPGR